jgi:hypothetical protein
MVVPPEKLKRLLETEFFVLFPGFAGLGLSSAEGVEDSLHDIYLSLLFSGLKPR